MKSGCRTNYLFRNHQFLEHLVARIRPQAIKDLERAGEGVTLGFLERKARWTLPTDMPSCSEMARSEAPEARRRAILPLSTSSRGLPSVRPLFRAWRIPALTRS
jgi:hypothetical protein